MRAYLDVLPICLRMSLVKRNFALSQLVRRPNGVGRDRRAQWSFRGAPLIQYPEMVQWYESEVQELERAADGRVNGNRPPVFYGSSSIRLWETLAEDFDPRVLNLGFGGSTLEACDYFFARLVPPVHPRSLLIYAGDNG